MSENSTQLPRDDDGRLITYAWPGGYPVYYVTADGGVLCPDCARMAEDEKLSPNPDDTQWHIIAADVNYEDCSLDCDHCYQMIECAYPPDDAPTEDDYQTQDHIHFYQYGKLVLTIPPDADMWETIQAHMDRESFWPDVWFISDHGNNIPITKP